MRIVVSVVCGAAARMMAELKNSGFFGSPRPRAIILGGATIHAQRSLDKFWLRFFGV